MKLIIAEKPELGRAIGKAIDDGEYLEEKLYIKTKNYIIVWLQGHILEYKSPDEMNEKYKKWSFDSLPVYFKNWEKKPIKGKEFLLKNIQFHEKKCTSIINAGDPDDEGQYLVDEVIEYLNIKKPIERILINDNSSEAIKKVLQKIENNEKYKNWGYSARARNICDMIVGYSLTRYFTLLNQEKNKNSRDIINIGRVQTPTLALIVKRDEEIENHIKEKFYNLFYNYNNIKFKYVKNDKNLINDISILENLINNIKNTKFTFTKEIKEDKEKIPLPFNLLKLQVEANKKFGFSVDKTLKITQSLRDNHSAITYNRSDSQYLSSEHFKESKKLVPVIAKKLNLENLNFNFDKKSECFNDANITAHHGIIPTFQGNIDEFSEDEKKIYILIAKRYLIQFLENPIIKNYKGIISNNNINFVANNKIYVSKGYLSIYKSEEIEEENNENNEIGLENLNETNLILDEKEFTIKEEETKAKKRYTEGSLIQDMCSISKYVKDENIKKILKNKDKNKKGENGSIGTPATRAEIINKLIINGYIEKQGKNIISTIKSKNLINSLPDILISPELTALWWVIQEDIKNGIESEKKLIDFTLEKVNFLIKQKYENLNININKKENIKNTEALICPCCKSKIFKNENNYRCGNKNCNFTLWISSYFGQEKKELTEKQVKELLLGNEILINDLLSKQNKKYSAYFKIDIETKKIKLSRFDNKYK